MRRIVLLLLCLIAVQRLCSQEIKGVEGQWAIVNITPEQAREKAIDEAKKEALRRAGIHESIRTTRALSVTDNTDDHRQWFSEFSSIEMNGAVTDYTIVKDEQLKNSIDGRFYAVVVINATVKKYRSVADPEFTIDVRGLRSNGYKHGEEITFSVHPNREGYLQIFLLENMDTAVQLFPNAHEPGRKLKAKTTCRFPLVEGIAYTAEKSTADGQEHNLLLFVYTKSDIPFYGEATGRHVLGWINGMEPAGRMVVTAPLLITE